MSRNPVGGLVCIGFSSQPAGQAVNYPLIHPLLWLLLLRLLAHVYCIVCALILNGKFIRRVLCCNRREHFALGILFFCLYFLFFVFFFLFCGLFCCLIFLCTLSAAIKPNGEMATRVLLEFYKCVDLSAKWQRATSQRSPSCRPCSPMPHPLQNHWVFPGPGKMLTIYRPKRRPLVTPPLQTFPPLPWWAAVLWACLILLFPPPWGVWFIKYPSWLTCGLFRTLHTQKKSPFFCSLQSGKKLIFLPASRNLKRAILYYLFSSSFVSHMKVQHINNLNWYVKKGQQEWTTPMVVSNGLGPAFFK